MERIRKTVILLALFAILPAAHSTITPSESLCFASGSATYRLCRTVHGPVQATNVWNPRV